MIEFEDMDNTELIKQLASVSLDIMDKLKEEEDLLVVALQIQHELTKREFTKGASS